MPLRPAFPAAHADALEILVADDGVKGLDLLLAGLAPGIRVMRRRSQVRGRLRQSSMDVRPHTSSWMSSARRRPLYEWIPPNGSP